MHTYARALRIPYEIARSVKFPVYPLLCAKFQGHWIWRSCFMAVFVSVRKDEEKEGKKTKKNKETKSIFEVAYLGNA